MQKYDLYTDVVFGVSMLNTCNINNFLIENLIKN